MACGGTCALAKAPKPQKPVEPKAPAAAVPSHKSEPPPETPRDKPAKTEKKR